MYLLNTKTFYKYYAVEHRWQYRLLANCLINSSALPANPQNMKLYGCIRLPTQICLTLTTLLPFKNTTPINQRKGKLKDAEQTDQINRNIIQYNNHRWWYGLLVLSWSRSV